MLEYELDSLDGVPDNLKSLYKEQDGKYILQVKGVKTQKDIDSVSTALNKERLAHKETKQKLDEYSDIRGLNLSPTEILAKLDRVDELEAAAGGKIDESKLEKMVETRLKSKLAPVERERDQLKTQLSEREQTISQYTERERVRTIHDSVRKAAQEGKIIPSAVEDVLMIAERVFEADESGKVIAKDNVGVTPGVDPSVWLSEMQQKRPHWWPASQGGGGKGSSGAGGFSNNPWSKEHWNITEQGRMVREDKAKADQMAKSAGSFIGATKATV